MAFCKQFLLIETITVAIFLVKGIPDFAIRYDTLLYFITGPGCICTRRVVRGCIFCQREGWLIGNFNSGYESGEE